MTKPCRRAMLIVYYFFVREVPCELCYMFFEDACTVKEMLDIAQRLEVAKMLADKQSYAQIAKETGMSTATISRVSRCLMYGAGGYRLALERMGEGAAPEKEK